LLIGSANRDPRQFAGAGADADADALDIARAENKHIGFGHGIHFCLGAPLARLEARIALGTLVRRLANVRLANDDIEWRDNFSVRGPVSLPLAFTA